MADRSVLIVIDNVTERKTIIKELEKSFGIKNISQTHTAKNALNAMRESGALDLIICDIDLPDSPGIDFVKQCKKTSAGQRSAYILTSNRQDKPTLLAAAAAGINDFIVKPYTATTVQQKIAKLFKATSIRAHERVALFEAVGVMLQFEGKQKKAAGRLLDLSLGGCQITCEVLGPEAGSIYSKVSLAFQAEGVEFAVTGELVRMEKFTEGQAKPGTLIKAAFQFLGIDPKGMDQLTKLMSLSNSPS